MQEQERWYSPNLIQTIYLTLCFRCSIATLSCLFENPCLPPSIGKNNTTLGLSFFPLFSKWAYVNPDETVLMGCSQGGFVSAIAASRLHDKISKLVLFYPAFCIPDDARADTTLGLSFFPLFSKYSSYARFEYSISTILSFVPCWKISLWKGRNYTPLREVVYCARPGPPENLSEILFHLTSQLH